MRSLSKTRPKAETSHPPRHDRDSDKSFSAIMADTTHAMPRHKRTFSAFIHSKAIWSISDLLSRTIARPNAIFFGAVFSFIFTIGAYLLSKNFGYSLSGAESVSSFLVGWTIGILFDIVTSLGRKK